jgi:Na+-driven multidrug efflux pump
MSVEGPYLSALIARLSEPKFNLAAYGIAYSLALIVEAPVIMMMSASTALVKNYQSYIQLKKFNYGLMIILTSVMLLFNVPLIFYFITQDLIGLPYDVAYLTHLATLILIPWPAAIGYRRFYQGILIRNNKTRLVAYGTVIRLASMSLTAFTLFEFTNVPGVVVGATALSTAVVCEAIASKVMVHKIVRKIKEDISEYSHNLNFKEILEFYYPLAITSMLTLGVQPFVTFLIGQSKMPLESFAVMPVVTSFVFIFRALGLSFQEVVIALLGENNEEFIPLKNFATKLALILNTFLIIIAFSPLAEIWFKNVSGLSQFLTDFARIPLMIMSFFPAFTVLISFQRAILVKTKITKQITYGTAIEFIGIISVLALCIHYFELVGVIAATIAFVIGRIAVCSYLTPPSIRALKIRS